MFECTLIAAWTNVYQEKSSYCWNELACVGSQTDRVLHYYKNILLPLCSRNVLGFHLVLLNVLKTYCTVIVIYQIMMAAILKTMSSILHLYY